MTRAFDVLATAYRTLFVTLPRLVVGKRLSVRMADGDLRMTVTSFDPRWDVRSLAAGHLGDAGLEVRDIRWNGSRFDRATAVLHRVRVSRSAPPELVAGPVELTLHVPPAALDELFGWVAPRLTGEVDGDAVARLRLAGRPTLGHLEIDAELDEATLLLQARAVTLGRTRWKLPGRTPAYRVNLPELPHGLKLTAVAFEPGRVLVSGTLPEWRMALPLPSLG